MLVGCPPGGLPDKVQMPEVSGVVVDAETGEPVAGAEVFIHWGIEQPSLFTALSIWKVGSRWTTTDAMGHFLFAARPLLIPEGARDDGRLGGPNMQIVSRSHFEPVVIADWIWDGKQRFDARHPEVWAMPRTGVVRAARTLPHDAEAMENKRLWGDVCGSISTDSANTHCCEVIYHDPDFCCKAVYGTRGADCSRPQGPSED
jgi:hypothetical protein